MNQLEKKLWAEQLFESSYNRRCDEYEGYYPILSKDDVLSIFLADTSSLSPIESMRAAIEKSYQNRLDIEDEELSEERMRKSCSNCSMGDGEGGCTIPGYCTDMSEFENVYA